MTIDGEGYLRITDRSKDVIKSGGEWISSIELENLAMSHPDIVEAAVIGVFHTVGVVFDSTVPSCSSAVTSRR